MNPALFPFLLYDWDYAVPAAGGGGGPTPPIPVIPEYDLDTARQFVTEVVRKRGKPSQGYNPHRFVELHGGTMVEPTAHEPDPATHRQDYYYNSVTNALYKRIYDRYEPKNGIIVAHWKMISN